MLGMRMMKGLGHIKRWHQQLGARSRFVFIVLLFMGLLVLFFYEVTFQGKTFKTTTMHAQAMPSGPYGQGDNYGFACPLAFRDSAAWEEPVYQFFKRYWAQGIFPFWDPHQGYGYPSAVYLFVGVLFPLTFFVYLLPNAIGWDVFVLSRLLVAGLSMYWFMKVLGFRFVVRMIAACSFMLSGPFVVSQVCLANTYILLPLLLGFAYKVFQSGTLKDFLLFSFIVALNGFAGTGEDMFLACLLTAGYFVFLFFPRGGKDFSLATRSFVKVVLFSILGIAVAGVVLVPFLAELFQGWNDHSPATGQIVEEARKHIVTLLIPRFFNEGLMELPTFERHAWNGGYLGILLVGIALMSAWNRKRRALAIFFGIIAVLTFGKMFGFSYASWIGYLPLLNLMRLSSTHLSHIFIFSLALLVGIGLEAILIMPKCFNKIAAIFAILAGYVASQLWIYHREPFFSQSLRSSAIGIGFLVVALLWVFIMEARGKGNFRPIMAFGLLFLLLAELFFHVPRYRPKRFDSFPSVPYINFLKKDMAGNFFRVKGLNLMFSGNTGTAYGIDSVDMACVVSPVRYVNFTQDVLGVHLHKLGEEKKVSKPSAKSDEKTIGIFATTNVKYIVTPPSERGGPGVIYNKEARVLALPYAVPRAYVAYDFEVMPKGADKEICNRINERYFSIVQKVILEKEPGENLPTAFSEKEGIILPAQIRTYNPNKVEIFVSTPRAGVLVFLDAYHPDWKAWVDGVPSKVYPANYLFRAVFVPAGDHVVVFKFVPFWFYIGGAITLIGLGIWSILFFRKK